MTVSMCSLGELKDNYLPRWWPKWKAFEMEQRNDLYDMLDYLDAACYA